MRTFLLACCTLFVVATISATPTSLYWTNCTTQVQEEGTVNLSCENYFTFFQGHGKGSAFSPGLGATYGLFKYQHLSSEVGIDYVTGKENSFYFNGKLAIDEAALFTHCPSMSVGLFGVGTKHSTKQNVLDFILGKSLPDPQGGLLYVGAYHGAQALGKNKSGIMAGFEKGFCRTCDEKGASFDRWYFLVDYASGKNVLGGTGVALAYYFSPLSWIETGPVWFNSTEANGSMKWGLQFNFGVRTHKPERRPTSL